VYAIDWMREIRIVGRAHRLEAWRPQDNCVMAIWHTSPGLVHGTERATSSRHGRCKIPAEHRCDGLGRCIRWL